MAYTRKINRLRFRYASTPPSGGLTGRELIFDDFNYDVSRSASGTITSNPFTNWQGSPWALCKSEQFNETGANGWLYTTTSIPGYSGAMPGVSGTGRVLCAEFQGALQGQTDTYLQTGTEGGSVNYLPADVWIQFWVYMQNYGAQAGANNDMKFLYPSQTIYPRPANEMWLAVLKRNSGCPYFSTYQAPAGNNGFFHVEHPEYSAWSGEAAWNEYKLSHTDGPPPTHLAENGWRLLRFHFDTSGQTLSGGIAEAWVRDYGNQTFLKFMDWQHGSTVAGSSFSWPLPNNNGAKMLKLFTTTESDFFLYMADFAVAAGTNSGGGGINDLPSYHDY